MTKEDHRKLGITFFNKTWEFIDKKDRLEDDNLAMINYAHASLLHWELSDCEPVNKARGLWQVANVYCTLNMGESALKYALACYKVTIQNNISGFDLVFAHHIMALAHSVLKQPDEIQKHLELGYLALKDVEKQEDREYCKNELDKILEKEKAEN